MSFKKHIYQGYVQLNEFNNIYLPPPIQNLIIKNFCDQNNLIFKLSVNEHYIKNSYMELFFILKKIKKIDGLIMTSIYMLPQDKKNFSINPRELVSKTYQFEEIVGNDAEHNAKKIIELFNGKESAFLEIVSLNCAAALVVAEKELSLKDAFDYSRKYILSGIVIKKINELKQ